MRASRALVVFLVLSLAIVLVFAKTRRPATPLPSGRILPATPTALTDPHPRPLLVLASNLIAPTTLPTTMPTTAPVAIAPTTHPATIVPAPEIIVTRPTSPLAEARSKLVTDPLSTRRILNEELLANHLTGTDLDEARELLIKSNEQLVFSPRAFRDDPLITSYTIQPGDRLVKIASAYAISADFLSRINGIADARRIKPGQNIKIIRGPFHAVVSKSRFMLEIYLGAPGGVGSTFITSYRVGLGKDDSTPAGTWKAGGKLRHPDYFSPRGEGVISAGDPKNPLGEYWIGLTGIEGGALGKNSYGIHGTIDPSSIGRDESMGCIRMRNEDVAIVFELLVEGKSTIIVRD